MAQVIVPRELKPTQIEKFLGLNQDTSGETELRLGESPDMVNFRLTENYKLKKRNGYTQQFSSIGSHTVQGMWYGKISGAFYFLFAANSAVWLKQSIQGTGYNTLDTSTYTNVDVVKTTALIGIAGTTAVDAATIVNNSSGTTLTEVAQANIDLVASVGKYYYHTDNTLWFIVAKGAYASIAAARTALGTAIAYVKLGTLTNAKTSFFAFNNKVYLLNGTDYKSWDGTTFGDVAGYIPIVATATPPAGGGTSNETINLLTGKKRQLFSGNNSSKDYYLAETALTSVDVVKVGGVVQTSPTNYSVNLTTGVVTFVHAPATGVNNVDIQWTKGSGSRTEITANKFAMFFGGKNDTRIFVYGDGSNRYYYTGLADGVPSAEYFPALNYREVGSDEFAVTDIVRQYDRQIIYTNGNEAYYSYYDTITVSGNVIPDFPTFPLNQTVGNVAYGQCQIIQNNPFSIQNGVYEWVATNVRDERNAVYKSKRVQTSLELVDLTQALTIDFEIQKEYWLTITNKVWIYNYQLDAWVYFELQDTPSCYLIVDDELYFGTTNGTIMKFSSSALTDQGTAIDARWEMNFYNFEVDYLRKYLNDMWISIKPESYTSVDVTYQTDLAVLTTPFVAQFILSTFLSMNFSSFSFLTNYNPQPFRFKIRAKKFVYFKLICENDETNETLTILSITLPARMGSKVK
jgi:hypothetical protein